MKNALKFTQSGQINIKVSYNDTEQLLIGHVKDTGSGIAKNDMPTPVVPNWLFLNYYFFNVSPHFLSQFCLKKQLDTHL